MANLDAQMNFRSRNGGLTLRKLERATDTVLVGLFQARDSDQFSRFTLQVEAAEPHRITQLGVNAIPRPAEFPVERLSDSDLVEAVQARLEREAAADRFAGTVLIARDGEVLFSEAYGLADREANVPNTLDSQFRLGSMNKMFTAVSVLQLVAAGKIELTDTLGEYIPDYPNRDIADKVTIHHLLSHTGGTGDFFGPEYQANRTELKDHEDYLALFGARAPLFEPGSRYQYSNYGMILLGAVIERVSGQSYYDYVTEHVYEPAGMSRSGSEPESEAMPGRAVGYTRGQGNDWTSNAATLGYRGTAAGGGYSTVGDLLKFAEALFDHALLDEEYTDLLITGKVDAGDNRYAYGFVDARKDGEGWVGHSGGAPGMSGELRIYPDSGYVVAVLSNLDPPAAPQVASFVDLRLEQ
jgi:CubicO group peptidase (beta-lactamase class C family)